MLRILLINPAFSYIGKDTFPLALGYLAAIALKMQHEVDIIDENINQKIEWERIPRYDLIGITSTTPAFPRAQSIITELNKSKNASGLILIGGHHATYNSEETLNCGADIAVRGEGEIIFEQLLQMIAEHRDWGICPGISYHNKEGCIIHNPPPPLIPNLDTVPFPAWKKFDYNHYALISVTTSRGCPYHCSYCAAADFWHHSIRFRSTENVIQELDELMQVKQFPLIKFQDSIFTLQRKRIIALLEAIIARNYPFRWICETRIDTLDDEIIDLMHQAKCKVILLGLESGSQALLDRHDRKMDLQSFAVTCQKIMGKGIGLRISVIFGLPGETIDTVNETITLLKQIKPNVTLLSLASIYPGSGLENYRTTKHHDLWLKTFSGHGIGAKIILPDGMTAIQYRKLAKYLQKEINELNRLQWIKDTDID